MSITLEQYLQTLRLVLSHTHLTFMRSLCSVHLLDVSIKVVWPAENIQTDSLTHLHVATCKVQLIQGVFLTRCVGQSQAQNNSPGEAFSAVLAHVRFAHGSIVRAHMV